MLKQIRWNVLCNAAENGLRVVSAYAFQAGASGFSHSRVQQEKAAENSFWTRLLIPSPLFACRHHGYARHDAKVGRRNVSPQKTLPNGVGASRILLDAHIPFDIVDAEMDWSGCRFPLLPDEVLLFPVFARKR